MLMSSHTARHNPTIGYSYYDIEFIFKSDRTKTIHHFIKSSCHISYILAIPLSKA